MDRDLSRKSIRTLTKVMLEYCDKDYQNQIIFEILDKYDTGMILDLEGLSYLIKQIKINRDQ